MTDIGMRWIPRFVFGDTSFDMTYPMTQWNPGARTVGRSMKSGTGIPGVSLRLRKYVLNVALRFTESEWSSVRALISFGQTGAVFTWYPRDAETVVTTPTSLSVFLDTPRIGDGIRPQRDANMPWMMSLNIGLVRADGLPWGFEYFLTPQEGPHHVTVTLLDDVITTGGTTQASAIVYNILNEVLTTFPVTWSTSNESLATVDADGTVTALDDGLVDIRATAGGVTGSRVLDIDPFPGFYRSITIDHTKCGTADTNNFVLLFTGTFAYLKTKANGGKVERADGFDLVFAADTLGLTILDFHIESWNPATGDIIAWVRVPTISVSADTVIYLHYGHTGINSSQQDAAGTYDADYTGVWHLGDGVALSGSDKTANANHLALVGGTDAVAAQIDGGANISAVKMLTGSIAGIVGAYTYEFWFRATSNPGGVPARPVRGGVTSDSMGFSWSHNNATFVRAAFQQNAASAYFAAKLTTVVIGGVWYRITITWDGANLRAYLNGVLEATVAVASIKAFTGIGFQLGEEPGRIDEVRLSKVARSASYVLASYNNQNSPATFVAIGLESFA